MFGKDALCKQNKRNKERPDPCFLCKKWSSAFHNNGKIQLND